MGFRVEGVTRQASLQTCLLHACSSIHGGGWLGGLVHQPSVRELASLESRNGRTAWPAFQHRKLYVPSGICRYSLDPELFLTIEEGDIHRARNQTLSLSSGSLEGGMAGGKFEQKVLAAVLRKPRT